MLLGRSQASSIVMDRLVDVIEGILINPHGDPLRIVLDLDADVSAIEPRPLIVRAKVKDAPSRCQQVNPKNSTSPRSITFLPYSCQGTGRRASNAKVGSGDSPRASISRVASKDACTVGSIVNFSVKK